MFQIDSSEFHLLSINVLYIILYLPQSARSARSALTCAESFTWNSTTFKKNTTCADGELCYVAGAIDIDSAFFSRRGCISGYTYFNPTPSCLYDDTAFTRARLPDPAGFFCACNESNCNQPNPTIDVVSTGAVEIQLGKKKSLPTTRLKTIACHAFQNHFKYNGDESTIAIEPVDTRMTESDTTTCEIYMWLKVTGKKKEGGYQVDGGRAEWTNQFYHVDELALYPPSYLGLFISYQYDVDYRYYYFVCNYAYCNNHNQVGNIAIGQNATCYVGLGSVKANATWSTCRGQFCFYATDPTTAALKVRGCLSQDYSKAKGRIEVGLMKFASNYYICAEDLCNESQEKALQSIKAYQPEMPPFVAFEPKGSSSTTSSPSSSTQDLSITSDSEPIETTTKLADQPLSIGLLGLSGLLSFVITRIF